MKEKPAAYQNLAGILRLRITSGKWEPGARLPTEMELAKAHTVSRITVRHALQLLEQESLIVRRPKLGTFVSSQPQRMVPVSIDYTGSLHLHAPEAQRELIACRPSTAGEAADLLKLTEDASVLYSERRDSLNGSPFAWDKGIIPMRCAKNVTEKELAAVSLVEQWSKKEKVQISSIEQTVETVTDKTASKQLKLPAKHPLLKTTECYFDQRNRPCGIFITFYNPEQVQLHIRYSGSLIKRRKNRTAA
jgi:DNA-binding GntR family transcriptional regulator